MFGSGLVAGSINKLVVSWTSREPQQKKRAKELLSKTYAEYAKFMIGFSK